MRRATMRAPSNAQTATIRKMRWCISSRHFGPGAHLRPTTAPIYPAYRASDRSQLLPALPKGLIFAARFGISQVKRLFRHPPVRLRHLAREITQERRLRMIGQILVLARQCPVVGPVRMVRHSPAP
jgi:hypothetical protein